MCVRASGIEALPHDLARVTDRVREAVACCPECAEVLHDAAGVQERVFSHVAGQQAPANDLACIVDAVGEAI